MTDTRKAQLEIGVNAGPAEEGFKRVERAGKGMADAVGKSADTAGKAVGGIGEGADKGAQKLDKATSSIIASVQRTTAAMQAGEKGTAKYFEQLATQRGVNADVLKPYLDGLRAVELAQGKVGMSAKATAAAMRGVPAQFTDIITSLQGGQAPLTVLLQQGGQLKDVFGGVGNAAKALGGYVVGLVNPFTVAAAAGGVLALAYAQGSKEADEFRKALVLSGNAAGASVGQLSSLAESIGSGFGKNVGQAAAALTVLAASGGVGRASLKEFATTAIEAEKAFGLAGKEIAKNFADLAKDPLAASVKLNESMNYLTVSTYAQIKAAQDLGQDSKAAALAQDAYNAALKGRSAEVLQSAGTIEKAWAGIKSAATGAWDAMLGVGRPVTVSSQIGLAQKNLEAAIEKRKSVSDDSAFAPALDKEIAKLKEQTGYLGEIDRLQKRAGDSAAEQARQTKARIEADKDGLKYLSDQERMQRDIAQQVSALRTAKASEAEIEQRIAQIKASYAKKGDKAQEITDYEKLNRRIGDFAALQEAASQSQSKLTEGQKLSVKIAEDMSAAGTKLSATEKQRLQTMLDTALATEQRNIIDKETTKLMEDSIKLQAAAVAQSEKSTASVRQQAVAEREAMASIGLTKKAIAELTAAKYDDSAASKERLANIMAEAGEPELLIKKYREEAQALRDLALAKRERGVADSAEDQRKIAAKAALDAQKEWQRAAEKIQDSLTDALMRGFESGKGFAQTLKDTVINMFKTMVLRPVIQAVVGGVTGLGGGTASAGGIAGSLSSAFGIVDAVKNVYSTITGGFAALGDTVAFAAQDIGAWMVQNTTGVLNSAGSSLIQASNGLGAAASYVGGIAAGIGLGNLISGQYSLGGSKNTATVSGTALGAILGGPIGAAIGGALGGLVNRAFGLGAKQTTAQGITGTFGAGSGSNVQAFESWFQKGGWFRSNKSGTNYSAVSSELDQFLDGAINQITNTTKLYATVLGLSADAVSGFTKSISISLIGLDAAGKEKAITDALVGFGNSMAAVLISAASPFARAGETAGETLSRLSTSLISVNGVLNTLNQTLLDSTLASGDAASKLLDLFGGLENFNASTGAYYQAYYTEAERNAKITETLTKTMQSMGLTLPKNLQGFRQLVEAQDLNTDVGRQTYTALMALAPAFSQVATAATNAQGSLAAIAQERQSLQDQLDNLTGNTSALRERERAALDESNRALYDQIQALNDQQTAAQAATEAENQRQEAIKSASATVLEEARRLRGQTAETGSAAFLQSQFAILTGQARAGDATALAKLPEITQALEQAAKASATSSLDFERVKASLAASLEATVATIALSNPPAALLDPATAEPVAAPAVSLATLAASTGTAAEQQKALIDEVRALREQVANLLTTAQATAVSSDKTARTFDLVTQGTGTVMVTTV